MKPDEQFRRGIEEFNRREFFETHETLEAIWLNAPEPEKAFLQGLIQVASAFHHFLRGNSAGAKSLLRRGLEKLETFPEQHGGIEVEPLRESLRWWLGELATGRNPGRGQLPRIITRESK